MHAPLFEKQNENEQVYMHAPLFEKQNENDASHNKFSFFRIFNMISIKCILIDNHSSVIAMSCYDRVFIIIRRKQSCIKCCQFSLFLGSKLIETIPYFFKSRMSLLSKSAKMLFLLFIRDFPFNDKFNGVFKNTYNKKDVSVVASGSRRCFFSSINKEILTKPESVIDPEDELEWCSNVNKSKTDFPWIMTIFKNQKLTLSGFR